LIVKLRELSGVPVMLSPSNQKGEVVIKTKFGEVVADTRNFSKPSEELTPVNGKYARISALEVCSSL
jgi:hypothetical protein